MFCGADDRQALVGRVPAELVSPADGAYVLIIPSSSNMNLLHRDSLMPMEVITEVLVVELAH